MFTFDFFGTCHSSGYCSNISRKTIIEDFETIVGYIKTASKHPIFLFGATGTGGILGQFYAPVTNEITTFAQYGQVSYRDISFLLKFTKPFISIAYHFVNGVSMLFPNIKIAISIPKFTGYNAAKEDELYAAMQDRTPNCSKVGIRLIQSLLWFMCDKKRPISIPLDIPTLVFNARHDRYFTNEYVQGYYDELKGHNKIIHINDCQIHIYFIRNLLQWKLICGSKK